MKDSGIEWIGEIPEEWEVGRLKNYAIICNGLDFKDVYKEDGEYPVMGSGGEFSRSSQFMYDKPTVLLGRKGTINRPLFVNFPFWTVDTMYYTIIREGKFPKYFYYLCLIINFDFYQYGSAVPSMTQRDLNNINFPLPPLHTQSAISNFLDLKCGKIDEVIALEKRQIEKLKEYRQSVITEAVTKGLDKSAPMKDSGIEWIGAIPKEWEIIRLRFLCSIDTGSKDTINKVDEGQYPFYVRSPKIERIDTYSFDGEAILMAGDGVGAGKVFHYVNGKFDYHQRVYNLHHFKNMFAKFLFYYLSESFWKEIEQSNAKSTVDSIRLPMIQDFPVCCPSISTQSSIANFLDRKTAEINSAIAKKEILIEKLSEYKKSLIYEAVTGKKEIV